MKSERKKIFVFGASGHAKVVIDIIERQGIYDIAFLIDDDPILRGANCYGYRVIGGKQQLLDYSINQGIVAIGSNSARTAVAVWLKENGFHLVSAVHPSAELGRGVTVGVGTVIMAGAVVNSDTNINSNVIINTRASVDHDCVISESVHIAPGATLCGTVRVGAGCFICAGSTIIPNLTIGSNVIVGAGSTVIRDLPDNVTAVGNPAMIVKQF
ncbi:MAG: acetyltransferase [Geobacteraceae bacterium]|nr:acetyltransferase [Geobacteraceae bacterium]